MALPFIAGLALGAAAVVLFKNNKTIQDTMGSYLGKGKDLATCSFDKTKDLASDVKDTVLATKDCISEKKAEIKNSKKVKNEEKEEEV